MANRAYLFSSDLPDAWAFPEDRYYDSRWNIPLSWFFFYELPDIKHVRVTFMESAWDELKLASDREAAIRRFEVRRPVLEAAVGAGLPTGAIDALVNDVRGWQGRYLLLDPEEILDDEAEKDLDLLSRILQAIEMGGSDAVLEAARRFVYPFDDDPKRCRDVIIGCTYW